MSPQKLNVASVVPAPISRRQFLSGLAAGSLVLAMRVSASGAQVAIDGGGELPFEPNLWLSIAGDGAVTIVTHRSEMGTGIRTSLPMVVADELGADWDRVTLRQATADARLGSQNTDGSTRLTFLRFFFFLGWRLPGPGLFFGPELAFVASFMTAPQLLRRLGGGLGRCRGPAGVDQR